MQILANNACGRMLPNIYIMLIIFGVIAFAILVGLCFLTCSVSRNTDKWVQQNGRNAAVKSESDQAASAPKSPRSRTAAQSKAAQSRVNTGSSREILADVEREDKDIAKNYNGTGPSGEKLQLKMHMKPAHGRARYRARNMH